MIFEIIVQPYCKRWQSWISSVLLKWTGLDHFIWSSNHNQAFLFWHFTGFGSVNHIGGLMRMPGSPLICGWKFIKIYKNVSHMWPVVESGLDLMIASLVIWSVGWIMPLHQILSTPDTSSAAVKGKQKAKKRARWSLGEAAKGKKARDFSIIQKQDKGSFSVSSGLFLIERVILDIQQKCGVIMILNPALAVWVMTMFVNAMDKNIREPLALHTSASLQSFVNSEIQKSSLLRGTEDLIVKAVLLQMQCCRERHQSWWRNTSHTKSIE